MGESHFEVAYGRFDIFILFIERALKLLRDGGRLGLIVPYSVLNENYAKMLRAFVLNSCAIEAIVDLSKVKVFEDASVATCILILRKESQSTNREKNKVKILDQEEYSSGIDQGKNWHEVLQAAFLETPLNSFRLDRGEAVQAILKVIEEASIKVGDLCYVITGAVLHDSKTGASKERLIHSASRKGYKPYIEAKEIRRYGFPNSVRFLDYRVKGMHRPKFPELFENEKIMVQMVAGDSGLIATIDDNHLYTDHSLHLCVRKDLLYGVKRSQIKITEAESNFAAPYSPKYILAHLNSTLGDFYFRKQLEGDLTFIRKPYAKCLSAASIFPIPPKKASIITSSRLSKKCFRSTTTCRRRTNWMQTGERNWRNGSLK